MKQLLFLFVFSIFWQTSYGFIDSYDTDTVIVQITDVTLESIYKSDLSFSEPTILEYPNLIKVNSDIFIRNYTNLVAVRFPVLKTVGLSEFGVGGLSFNSNTDLYAISAPVLETIKGSFGLTHNTGLVELDMCNLTSILPEMEGLEVATYEFHNNTSAIDDTIPCFSDFPTDLIISGTSIQENQPANTLIGTMSAEGSNLTYFLPLAEGDNDYFTIVDNQLLSNSSFDYETDNEYTVVYAVHNPLGESIKDTVTINVLDTDIENAVTVEILDNTLEGVYYSFQSFSQPTILSFPNLTSVTNGIFIRNNINLIGVNMPALETTGGDIYVSSNSNLIEFSTPNLLSIYESLYISGNSALTQLDVCSLNNIEPDTLMSEPPTYTINSNTPSVDAIPFCFSIGAPTDVLLSDTTVLENENTSSLVGILSANAPTESILTYWLSGVTNNDNDLFKVVGNQLLTNSPFDFEVDSAYTISIVAFNQLGEKKESDFVIKILDVEPEEIDTIVISDTNLEYLYYSFMGFVHPTVLQFPNLTSITEEIFIRNNINLLEVDLPALTETGGAVSLSRNLSMQKFNAQELTTIYDYLSVSGNKNLIELNVCGLSEIRAFDSLLQEDTYYYINDNPSLDFSTTCLVNTTIEFLQEDPIIILPAPNTLVGTFTAISDDSIRFYFVDSLGQETTNEDFVIVGDKLYLAKEFEQYSNTEFEIDVNAIRAEGVPPGLPPMAQSDKNQGQPEGNSNGLNEKLALVLSIDIVNAIPLPVTWSTPCKATIENNEVVITWGVGQQTNNDFFVIQHGSGDIGFSNVGLIKGDGTTQTKKMYRHIHRSPKLGLNYYRIKQVDYDGRVSFSNISSVLFHSPKLPKIYPTLVTDIINVEVFEKTDLFIFDAEGRQVRMESLVLGLNQIECSNLAPGYYVLKGNHFEKKVLKK